MQGCINACLLFRKGKIRLKFTFRLFIICLFTISISAQSRVTLTIDLNKPGRVIPKDFIGESFETSSIRYSNREVKGYLFDSTDHQLLTIFKNLGLRSLRIGGATVDHAKKVPELKDIDALFHFAKAAGVKVIYTLRLTNGNAEYNASVAKYIWDHYRSLLDCFAIGNEPDWHSYHIEDPEIYETTPGIPGTAYPSYIAKWRRFAKAVLDLVPGAKFSGPNTGSNYPVPLAKDTGYNGKTWTVNFIDSEKNSGIISFFTQHNYVGQSTNDKTKDEVVNMMLSSEWDTVNYPLLYHADCVPTLEAGFPFRLTESNCFSEGIDGASNTFATALYALDYLHWWAVHNALGVNFHSTQWRFNATIRHDAEGDILMNPMGYGIAAFNIGGHGNVIPVTIYNPDSLNLTSYAVLDSSYLYVTVINKEHGSTARNIDITINTQNIWHNASVIYLTAPENNVYSKTGITLGGAEITNDSLWHGRWSIINIKDSVKLNLRVQASSAAIIKLLRQ